MLQINNLSVSYDGLKALVDINLEVADGKFVAIVGPNGAGKTTLFKAISGVVPIAAGSIFFDGIDLSTLAPARRPHLGIAHVPEGRQVFKSLTVLENLEMGARTKDATQHWTQSLDQIYALFPRLAERSNQFAGTLSGGEQQMVAIGRGLASRPKLLMFDEPSMGLSPAIADSIFECIEKIYRESKVAVLLVEQRVAEALQTCDHGYVLGSGRVILQGPPDVLINDPNVKRAYLGM
ncbi:ABC transporter ATP-binding protein [Glaciimonas sp. Gout2]|uniref:ABC transporter ATP-binding protein n=1 Tax=unclassified Glaciimonas TaxID=2644401 RepID=UPI002B2221AD|nr:MULTISPECIES: ABC transporter ATP-binding protein [unclassified Glaciimonas]MEB0011820.1 ABC transporter ATP-binding protein [Glaciimonas sp. Cout2]MEB0080624.1 ABC transporter ATP-binding protein [Glaciimonas sp. Gout2]